MNLQVLLQGFILFHFMTEVPKCYRMLASICRIVEKYASPDGAKISGCVFGEEGAHIRLPGLEL